TLRIRAILPFPTRLPNPAKGNGKTRPYRAPQRFSGCLSRFGALAPTHKQAPEEAMPIRLRAKPRVALPQRTSMISRDRYPEPIPDHLGHSPKQLPFQPRSCRPLLLAPGAVAVRIERDQSKRSLQ